VNRAAGGGKVAPFFRFPALQHPPQLLSYLAERNIGVFSTDIDSRDFKLHKPEDVIKSVMNQLEKHGKGIILMHDFKQHTAEALPELLRQLKAGGYKVVHMVRRAKSPPCRNTTKCSRTRTSCRPTTRGLRAASSAPSASSCVSAGGYGVP
jgi:hypothetical protein